MKKLQLVAVAIIALMLTIACDKDNLQKMTDKKIITQRTLTDSFPNDTLPNDSIPTEWVVVCGKTQIYKNAVAQTSNYIDSLTTDSVATRGIRITANPINTSPSTNLLLKSNIRYRIFKRSGLIWTLMTTKSHYDTYSVDDFYPTKKGTYKVVFFASCNKTTWTNLGYKQINVN
jgi:hypothetical protein